MGWWRRWRRYRHRYQLAWDEAMKIDRERYPLRGEL